MLRFARASSSSTTSSRRSSGRWRWRANLLIADDVGLGKTIEAGLVLQELLLRQRAEQVLIVCPASVTLQWQSEMQKKFGLHFELYDRRFVARRRLERGFGVNPWTTHNRFIIS